MNEEGDVMKALANLQEVLALKEKSLKEREDAFDKRVRLFEQEHPQSEDGSGRDIIHLNIGGSTHVAILRRSLTHFEHSMLATKFSGRWDDSLEKDKDGNYFIDEDPAVFMQLISYLRKVDKRVRPDIEVPVPPATFDFCWMLEYYDLIQSIYPHKWVWHYGPDANMTPPKTPNHPYVIETGHVLCGFLLDLDKNGVQKPTNIASLTVVFEKGSIGQIGWTDCLGSGRLGKDTYHDSLSLDIEGRCWWEKGREVATDLDILTKETDVTVCWTFDKETNTYAVEVVGSNPKIYRERKHISRWIPHLTLIGKAAISELSYSY